jgi:ribosomal protein S18 acetylase RimI-like enzyme
MWNTTQKLLRLGGDFRFYCRREGLRKATRWLAGVFLAAPYNRIEWIVIARSLESPLTPFEPGVPVEWRVAEPADFQMLADLLPPSEVSYLRRRFSNGRICVLAIHEKRAIGCGWIAEKVNFGIDNVEIRLKEGDGYIDDVFVSAAYRYHGIGRAINQKGLEYLRDHNFNRAVAVVQANNVPALALNKENGWVEVDRMTFRRILFWRKFRYHSGLF